MSQPSTDAELDRHWATKRGPRAARPKDDRNASLSEQPNPKQRPKTVFQTLACKAYTLWNRQAPPLQDISRSTQAVEAQQLSDSSNHKDNSKHDLHGYIVDDGKGKINCYEDDEEYPPIIDMATVCRQALANASVAVHRNIQVWEDLLSRIAHAVDTTNQYISTDPYYGIIFGGLDHAHVIGQDQALRIATHAVAASRYIIERANEALNEFLTNPQLLGSIAPSEAIAKGIVHVKEQEPLQHLQYCDILEGLRQGCRLIRDRDSSLGLSCQWEDLDIYYQGPMLEHVAQIMQQLKEANASATELTAGTLNPSHQASQPHQPDLVDILHRPIYEFHRADTCIKLAGRLAVHAEGMRRAFVEYLRGPYNLIPRRICRFVVLGDVDSFQNQSTTAVVAAEALLTQLSLITSSTDSA